MIANFLRCLLGLAMLPLCWSFVRTLSDSLMADVGGWCSVESLSLLGGMAAFALCWATLSHPVRTYVFGHELTHALWGLLFGAVPSDFNFGKNGGSVRLTKANVLITLAPYFFPFYTFVVILAGLVVYVCMRQLPFLPAWMFFIGFTWAFHVLFTCETLTQQQPDVKAYGRIFSWTVIFLANVALVLVWIACTTPLKFADLGANLLRHALSSYLGLFECVRWLINRF